MVKWNTLRSIVALAGHNDWKIYHLDVKTAFLHGTIDEELYVTPPPGFDSGTPAAHACRLKKALYGLKQAPRAWYRKMDDFLCTQRLRKSAADPNLYISEVDGRLMLLLLYVDDVYLTGNDAPKIAQVRAALKNTFDMSDLGLLSHSLGLEFKFTSSGLLLTQCQYVKELLADFGMADCRPVATPMIEKLRLDPDMAAPPVDSTTYQQMVGKLIFLTHTRPDIAFAVGIVSRFMSHPQEPHMQAVKHIYRYLKGSTDLALSYQRGGVNTLRGFTDADWAGAHDRKSTTGFLFLLGETPITWSNKRQSTVALSSTEAEYMALTEGTKEAIWLRRLFGELNLQNPRMPTTLHGDNQGSINLAHNPIYHARTKHVDVRHHFIREKVLSGEISLEYVPTGNQLADIFTKALGRVAFERIRSQLGLIKLDVAKTEKLINCEQQRLY